MRFKQGCDARIFNDVYSVSDDAHGVPAEGANRTAAGDSTYTPNMSSIEHQAKAQAMAERRPVGCAVLTISDTRTLETDQGGSLILENLAGGHFDILDRQIVKDEPSMIRDRLTHWIADSRISAILCTGGTGIARRDTTIDVVRSLITVELEGFGELFRMLSFQQVKAAAMMSRATAGLVMQSIEKGGDTYIFAMPGSTNAVQTAMENLIVPQLAHLVWERRKEGAPNSCNKK
jgi:molybdopterin adenylyltransferase